MNRVYSSGGVVLRKSEEKLYLLLVRKKDSGVWTLPKGHLDEGETEREAAVREVEEETGYTVIIGERVGEIHFTYTKNGQPFEEIASLFLMQPLRCGRREATQEISDAQWFSIDEALRVMTYENEKNIVTLAVKSWKNWNI